MPRPAWGPRVIAVLVFSGILQVLNFAVRPTLSYAAIDAGGPHAVLGIIAAAMAVPALFLALPAGRFIDRRGERPALVAGAALLIISCLLASMTSSVVTLLLCTVVFGLGHLLSIVGSQVTTGNLDDGRSLDARFGLFTFAASIGQTLGPLLLLLPGGTETSPPTHLVFLCCAGLAAVMLALTPVLRSSPTRGRQSRPQKMSTVTGQLLRTRGIPRALFASAVVLASLDLFVAYLPALGQEVGLSTGMVAVMLTARSSTSVISRLLIPAFLRLLGRRWLLILSIGIGGLMLIVLIAPLPHWAYLAVAAAYGFVMGPCQPVTMAWVTELAPQDARGMAMAVRLAGNRIAQAALPAGLGVFAASAGPGGVLALIGGVLGIAAYTSRLAEPGPGDEARARRRG